MLTAGPGGNSSSGQLVTDASAMATGTNSLSAAYAGDNTHKLCTSNAINVTVAAASSGATATTAMVSSNESQVNTNGSFVVTATIAAASGTAAPTGNVSFVDQTTKAVFGSAVLTATPSAASTASLTVPGSSLQSGANQIVAQYQGSPAFASSDSASIAVTENASAVIATTTASISLESPNVPAGGTVVLWAAINQANTSNSIVPTGQVSFIDLTGSNTVLATAMLSGAGNGRSSTSVTINASALAPGTNQIAVSYPGDGNFAASTSGSTAVVADIAVASTAAAARLLDQSSFGPTAATIAQVQKSGLPAYLNAQFAQAPTLYTEPANPGNAQCMTFNLHCTQSDFVAVSLFGQDQLRQRVALALSEIWVAPVHENNALPFYLNTMAADAFTNYRTIMNDLTLSPAMGTYLNMLNSGKPAQGEIANENFGRELMQLFTTGVELLHVNGTLWVDDTGQPVPVYTEAQVQAFARAFTGWTFANADGSSSAEFTDIRNFNAFMAPVESQHDNGAKTLLGGTTLPANQTAEQDLKDALDNIFSQPNVPPFICRQLIQKLVMGNPSQDYVARVANVFVDNGSGVRGDMKAVITAILMDKDARANDAQTGDELESAPAANGGHLREPLLWATALERALSVTSNQTTPGPPYPYVHFMSVELAELNEQPFDQPSVFNYYSPFYAIPQGDFVAGTAPATPANAPEFQLENTGSLTPRESLADYIAHNRIGGLTVDLSANGTIGSKASDPAALVDYLGMLLMHSQMPSDMRNILINEVGTIPSSDPQTRATVAFYLVTTSSQYKNLY